MRGWHDKYKQAGLTIVGVHFAGFPWEKPIDKVKDATAKLGIKFPVVQDNNFDIWKRYGVWAWPTIVLVDKKGSIRYSHIGEGAYGKTESTINNCSPIAAREVHRGESMLIKKPADIKAADIMPKQHYLNRRQFILSASAMALSTGAILGDLELAQNRVSPMAPRNSPTSRKVISAPTKNSTR